MANNFLRDIPYRCWQAESPKAVVLFVHGLGAYSNRWQDCAQYLTAYGISAYALDLRGFGQTNPPYGHVNSFDEYYQDILKMTEFIYDQHPGLKIFICGESMGGLIAFLISSRPIGKELFAGVICVSPAFANKLRFSFWRYCLIFSAMVFKPTKMFTMPFDSTYCTHDKVIQSVIENDPYEHRIASASLLFNILKGQFQSWNAAERLSMPVLFLLSGQDKLVNNRVSRAIIKRTFSSDREIIEYGGMYHSLTVEIEKNIVFNDMAHWIIKRA